MFNNLKFAISNIFHLPDKDWAFAFRFFKHDENKNRELI